MQVALEVPLQAGDSYSPKGLGSTICRFSQAVDVGSANRGESIVSFILAVVIETKVKKLLDSRQSEMKEGVKSFCD